MKKTLMFSLFVLLALFAKSQTFTINTQGIVSSCTGDLYDSGGTGGNYGDNENYIQTYHSTDLVNTHMRITFHIFAAEPGDTLIVYDGPNITSPVIGKYNNNNMPPPSVDATIYNSSGDLTFQFKSNASLNSSGWFCSLICYIPCQTILATLNPFMTIPPPNDSNYIDICIGDSIKFVATGSGPNAFPQAGVLYQQDSTTATYEWDFGDGTTAIGQIVTKLYNFARGYDIILNVTDIHNCTNINSLGTRVRISRNPFGVVHPVPDLCSSHDTTYVTIGYNSQSVIVIEPIESNQISTQRFDSTMFIPDGGICVPNCYNTNVTFNSFLPGQTITSAADILSVTMDIEHSYTGDLGFTLICPNGTSLVLDPNDHNGFAFFGVPNENDGSPTCSAASNPPGTGWVYGWSSVYPQQGTLAAIEDLGGTLTAADTVNHTNYFTPSNPFSGLIGCPLNGTWNLQICDDWASDNGYIFWWELNLSPNLLPSAWSYSVPIDTTYWSGSFFTVINDSTIRIVPDSGGIFQYTVTVVDAFGCTYDTTLNIEVVQTPDFTLGHDTVFCENQVPYILHAGPGDAYNWAPGGSSDSLSVSTTGIYEVTVTNSNIANTLQCKLSDTVSVTVNTIPTSLFTVTTPICTGGFSVVSYTGDGIPTATYTWDFDGGVATPSGGLENYHVSWATEGTYNITLTVTQNNCVSSTTSHSILISNLQLTANTTANVSCYGFANGTATVNALNGYYPYSYHWNTVPVQNTQNISNLPPGTYLVTVTDSLNCTAFSNVTVTQPTVLVSSITATQDATCHGFSNGSANATASGATPSYTYNWSGGIPNGSSVTGLSAGNYTVTVSDSHTCDTVLSFTINQPTALNANIVTTHDVICYNDNTGAASVSATNGSPPYTYNWSGGTPNGDTVTGLHVGTYYVTITDTHTCDTVLSFPIHNGPYIFFNLSAVNEICTGSCDGSITISALSDSITSPITYLWSNTATTDSITHLCNGSYTLTITDAHQCKATAYAQVGTDISADANGFADPFYFPTGTTVNFHYTGTTVNVSSYSWHFGDGDTSNLQNPTHIYTVPDGVNVYIYNDTVTITYGICTDMFIINVTVYRPSTIIIPNIITPNGDGINDEFKVKSEGLGSEKMMIYNRWGKKVYEWNQVHGSWNGKNGAEYSDGVYYYVLIAKGEGDFIEYNEHGTLTVIR